MIEDFIWLIFAHAIGDMGFQNSVISSGKVFSPMIMLAHSIIVAGCLCVALKYIGRYSNFKFMFLVVAHFLTDYLNLFFAYYLGYDKNLVNFFDQACHFVQIITVYRKE